jgi:hypothetical protein
VHFASISGSLQHLLGVDKYPIPEPCGREQEFGNPRVYEESEHFLITIKWMIINN